MKTILLFILFVIVGTGASVWYFSAQKNEDTQVDTNITPTNSKLVNLEIAPKQTLKASIESLSGDVQWTSRVATESAPLDETRIIQQGEELSTNDGSINIVFDEAATVQLSSNSTVEFAQTLPANIVLIQKRGSVSYNKTNTIPVSIRIQRALIDITDGEINLSIDEITGMVTIEATEGSARIAFNDLENVSTIVEIEKGTAWIYDNDLREMTEE